MGLQGLRGSRGCPGVPEGSRGRPTGSKEVKGCVKRVLEGHLVGRQGPSGSMGGVKGVPVG